MALTSILQDFEVRQGLIVLGTGTVTSSTAMTGTLQVYGGAAIAKNLIVGSTAEFGDNAFFRENLVTEGASFFTGLTSTEIVTITKNTQANVGGSGALQVTGGGYFGNNLVVNGIAQSTASGTANAFYVAGGAGIGGSLYVQGEAVFQNDVIFAGQTTYVYSTNTVYTDNILELHYHENSSSWTVNDGQDIGIRFHYFDTTNTNAFLGRDNATGYLEWIGRDVTEETTGTIEVGTYGTFKTGSIKLVDTTASNNTSSGALTVEGGVGVKGQVSAGTLSAHNLTKNRVVLVGDNGQLIDDDGLVYNTVTNNLSVNVGSSDSASNLAGGAVGSLPYQVSTGTTGFLPIGQAGLILISNGSAPTWATTSSVSAGSSFTATNINFGEQYQVPYQTGPGATTFSDNFKYDYNAQTFKTLNAVFSATTHAASTESGALQVRGGAGISGSLYVGSDTFFLADVNVSGGDITTDQTTFNLINTVATTVNLAGAATNLTVGATSGSTTIRNQTNLTISTQSTASNNGALVVTGGVGIGGNLNVAGTTNLTGNLTLAGDLAVNGGDITTTAATFNIANNNATTVNIAGAATTLIVGSTTGTTTLQGTNSLTSITQSTGTSSGALVVSGGVGIGKDLYVGGNEVLLGNLEVRGGSLTTDQTTFNLVNANATTVNLAGSATNLTIGATTGLTTVRNDTVISSITGSTSTNSGALTVYGGVGIAENLYVGGNGVFAGDLAINGGDLTTDAATFNLVNTNATTVNIAGSGTVVKIGSASGYTEIRNQTTVTDTTNAFNSTSGALQVRGGAAVAGNLWVNQLLTVIGASTLGPVRATVTTATYVTITDDLTVAGITSLTNTQNANSLATGALRTSGGASITRDVYVGGAITAGVTAAASPATVVPALYSNNMLLATYTSGVTSGITQFNLDSFSALVYRSARYFCQIVDKINTTTNYVHISEISLFHDGYKAYINEYGIATNNGQLGTFDAELTGNNVIVKFTPFNATEMTIKMVRIGVTA